MKIVNFESKFQNNRTEIKIWQSYVLPKPVRSYITASILPFKWEQNRDQFKVALDSTK